MTPKLKVIPSAIKLTKNEAATTTQPQPPSGGRASAISNDSLDDELEDDELSEDGGLAEGGGSFDKKK